MIDVFHIGYPRCGSTWLQRRFFPRVANRVNLIDKYKETYISNKDDIFYEQDAIKKEICDQIADDKINVYSSEALVGGSSRGNFSRTCRRLKLISPNAHILIIIRNQIDLLESLYKYNIGYGYVHSEATFLGKFCQTNNLLDILQFDKMIDCYRNEFENVHVELFECIFKEKDIRNLLKLCRVDELEGSDLLFQKVNSGHDTAISLQASLFMNRILATKLQGLENLYLFPLWRHRLRKKIDVLANLIGFNSKYHFNEKSISMITKEFNSSNKKLQKLFNFDIRKYGYKFN